MSVLYFLCFKIKINILLCVIILMSIFARDNYIAVYYIL